MSRYEVFAVPEDYDLKDDDGEPLQAGWYFWACRPGCLPDSDAEGPYQSEDEAQEAISEWLWDEAEERKYDEWKDSRLEGGS